MQSSKSTTNKRTPSFLQVGYPSCRPNNNVRAVFSADPQELSLSAPSYNGRNFISRRLSALSSYLLCGPQNSTSVYCHCTLPLRRNDATGNFFLHAGNTRHSHSQKCLSTGNYDVEVRGPMRFWYGRNRALRGKVYHSTHIR